jgi:hypothetical protein
VPRHGEVHRGGHLRLVGHVAAGVAGCVGAAELGRHGVAEVVLDVREDDLGAVPDELGGGRLPDAAGRAGDDCHLPGQPPRARGRGKQARRA